MQKDVHISSKIKRREMLKTCAGTLGATGLAGLGMATLPGRSAGAAIAEGGDTIPDHTSCGI